MLMTFTLVCFWRPQIDNTSSRFTINYTSIMETEMPQLIRTSCCIYFNGEAYIKQHWSETIKGIDLIHCSFVCSTQDFRGHTRLPLVSAFRAPIGQLFQGSHWSVIPRPPLVSYRKNNMIHVYTSCMVMG